MYKYNIIIKLNIYSIFRVQFQDQGRVGNKKKKISNIPMS